MRGLAIVVLLGVSAAGCGEQKTETPAKTKTKTEKTNKTEKTRNAKSPGDDKTMTKTRRADWPQSDAVYEVEEAAFKRTGEPGPTVMAAKVKLEAYKGDHYTLQVPSGWKASQAGPAVVFRHGKNGTAGIAMQVCVFSSERVPDAKVSIKDQLQRILEQVDSGGKPGHFEVEERGRIKKRSWGQEQTLVTKMTRMKDDVPVTVMRRVVFHRTRTFFAFAYAHEQEFVELRGIYKQCLNSLKPK